ISNNLESQLHQDLQSCEYFSLQFDESGDISGVTQLVKERNCGEEILFNAFFKFVNDTNLLLSKLVAIMTGNTYSGDIMAARFSILGRYHLKINRVKFRISIETPCYFRCD
ncbi:hypothetical protein C0J52_23153, partial [Blattella germanica]